MKKNRISFNVDLTFLLIILIFGFLDLTSQDLIAQNPKTTVWKSVGGKMVLSGEHKFTKTWTANSNNWEAGFWQGGLYEPNPKYVPYEPVVRNYVSPLVGQVTVRGPGHIGLYVRSKGASIYMRDAKTKDHFIPCPCPNQKFNPDGEFWGRIPADKIITIDVEAHMGSYDNRMNTGEFSYRAPQEVTYEVWFFPGKGGKVISTTHQSTTNISSGTQMGVITSSVSGKFSNAVAKPCGSDKEFIRSLYQSILDRDMEASFTPGHGGGYLRNLQDGDSRWKIIYSFFNSPEYKNKHKSHAAFIRDAYQAVLAREPKANEINAWPQIDRNTILIKFFNSEEYKKINNDCSNHKSTINGASLTGKWKLNQTNDFTGNMILQQDINGYLSGNVIWNGYLKGTIKGQLTGNAVSITIDYHNGVFGYYNGTLTTNGNSIVNGTVKSNNGVSANWNAIKIASGSITGKWKWFTNVIVTILPDGTVTGSNGGRGIWSQSIKDSQVEYIINWSNGQYIDRLKLNNNTLKGKNQNGTNVWATRINPGKTNQPWVIGIDSHAYYSTKSGWNKLPGVETGKDIAVDANGKTWIVSNDNRIFYYNGAKWMEYPTGRAIAISVAKDGTPWIIGTDSHIYYGTGTGWAENAGGGLGKDIAVDGKGRPWVIGSDNTIWYFDGARWVKYSDGGRGLAISVSRDGIPWIIGTNNHIYYGTGSGWVENPGGGIGKDIAIDADGRPWVIGSDNGIYYYSGTKWVVHSGRGKGYRISVIQ